MNLLRPVFSLLILYNLHIILVLDRWGQAINYKYQNVVLFNCKYTLKKRSSNELNLVINLYYEYWIVPKSTRIPFWIHKPAKRSLLIRHQDQFIFSPLGILTWSVIQLHTTGGKVAKRRQSNIVVLILLTKFVPYF